MRLEHRDIALADGRTRRVTTVMDADDADRRDMRRADFIRTLADNPTLYGTFDVMTISHDGLRWTAECEITLGRKR